MITIQYIFLHVLLIVVLFFSCKKIDSVERKYYWRYALIPILAFALEEGLRWGRGIDWCFYSNVYADLGYGIDTGHEPLFSLIWSFFSMLGFPYTSIIFLCSLFYIFSIFFLAKPFRGILKIFIPLVVLITSFAAENLIRWYLGISFLFISVRLFLQGKNIQAFFVAILSVLVHYGLILFLFLLPLLKKKNTIMSSEWLFFLSLFLLIAFSPKFLGQFAFLFDYLTLFSDRFDHYTNDPVDWLTGESQSAELVRRNWISTFVSMSQYYIFIYFIYKQLRIKRYLIPIYNVAVLGIILLSISSGIELVARYTRFFEPFILIIGSYVFLGLVNKMKNYKVLLVLLFCSFFILRKFIYFCNPSTFPHEVLLGYVWNDSLLPADLVKYYK